MVVTEEVAAEVDILVAVDIPVVREVLCNY